MTLRSPLSTFGCWPLMLALTGQAMAVARGASPARPRVDRAVYPALGPE